MSMSSVNGSTSAYEAYFSFAQKKSASSDSPDRATLNSFSTQKTVTAINTSASTPNPAAHVLLNGDPGFAPSPGAASAAHRRFIAVSCAVCMRSAGSLARHARTRRSSIGGVSGRVTLMASGSFSRMAVNTLSSNNRAALR